MTVSIDVRLRQRDSAILVFQAFGRETGFLRGGFDLGPATGAVIARPR